MMYHTSVYAVHEYQTSKAGVIIESHFGGLRCFSISLYSVSSPAFCPTFKTRSVSLRAGVLRVLLSYPPTASGRSLAILVATATSTFSVFVLLIFCGCRAEPQSSGSLQNRWPENALLDRKPCV